jgi:hypothetical protein
LDIFSGFEIASHEKFSFYDVIIEGSARADNSERHFRIFLFFLFKSIDDMAAALEKGCVSPQIVDRMKRVRQPILIVFMAASFVNAFPLQTPAFFGLSRLQQRPSAAAGPQFIGSSSNWQLHFAVNDESNADASMTAGVSIELTEKQAFPDAEFLEFVLEEHRPLGCTVEESLAHPKEKFVFVSKV